MIDKRMKYRMSSESWVSQLFLSSPPIEEYDMIKAESDERDAQRRAADEAIAAEPHLPAPSLGEATAALPMEAYLGAEKRHPVAVPGIVENGLVRPLDPAIKLAEHSRVIIVASGTP